MLIIILLIGAGLLFAAGVSGLYGPGGTKCVNGDIVVKTTAFKVLLVDNTYVFDPDHAFVADVIAGGKEVVATNYARKTLAAGAGGLSFTYLAASNRIGMLMPDQTWVGIGGAGSDDNLGGAVVYNNTGNDATSDVVAFLDPADLNTNGGDVLLDMDTVNGNIQIQL